MRCRGVRFAFIGVHPLAGYRASSGLIPLYVVRFGRDFGPTVSWSHFQTSFCTLRATLCDCCRSVVRYRRGFLLCANTNGLDLQAILVHVEPLLSIQALDECACGLGNGARQARCIYLYRRSLWAILAVLIPKLRNLRCCSMDQPEFL